MHELAIAESVVDAVIEKTGDAPVSSVRLRVGQLSGVLVDALRFAFEVATDGTALAGADLVVDEQSGRAACQTCGAEFDVPDAVLLCSCGSADVRVVAGEELRIVSVEVTDVRNLRMRIG